MMAVMCETFRVTLLPGGETFAAPAARPASSRVWFAGVALPWSCRNGSCRTCLAQLVEGRIEHRIPWPGLSREEKAEGWILPCVAEPRSDLALNVGP